MVQYYAAAPYPSAQGNERPLVRGDNGLGVAGFIISLLGFLTCGVLSPVGLLLSLTGLMRRPRGFAIAGTVLGLIGTALIGGFVAMTVLAAKEASLAVERASQEATTRAAIAAAEADVQQKIAESGELPEGIEGNKVVVRRSDAWGGALRYDRGDNAFTVRSAGADGRFDTADDFTSMSGGMGEAAPAAEEAPLIPLE